MKSSISHKTVSLKKKIKCPVQKVFKAFASVKARSEWSVPKGDAIEYLEADFSVGGKDVFKCGTPDSMKFNGVVCYEDIVKNKRIISIETITLRRKKLSIALITTDFIWNDSETEITLTAQVCSFDGANMSEGYKQGWSAVLNNLTEYLT